MRPRSLYGALVFYASIFALALGAVFVPRAMNDRIRCPGPAASLQVDCGKD